MLSKLNGHTSEELGHRKSVTDRRKLPFLPLHASLVRGFELSVVTLHMFTASL